MNKEVRKRVLLRTFGCQMNESDSELIRGILENENFQFVEDETQADIALVNTCTVRDNADRKALNLIHTLKNTRGKGSPLIGLLGCMATTQTEKLLANKKLGIDFLAGPDSYKRLPEIINQCLASRQSTVDSQQQEIYDITLSECETYSDVIPARVPGANAWISVMRGCDNFCSFCVVPYARGRERSRSVESVLREAREAVTAGFPQITLLGQNVNSYSHDGKDFADLLEEISNIPDLRRIRFMSPHPKDFPQKLLGVVASNTKVCKHIHLPLQAGNDRILKLMNRGYTQSGYIDLAKKIKTLCPSASITTDIIVGFPSETDQEFEDTRRVMEIVEFDSAFIFKYSPRPNTVAAKKFKDDVSDEKKSERTVALNELQKCTSLKKNQSHIGRIENVLIEQTSTKKRAEDFQGRTDTNKIVIFPKGPFKIGQFIDVQITDATSNVLKGTVVKSPCATQS